VTNQPPTAAKAEHVGATEEAEREVVHSTEGKRPITHESHTCDSCLTRPIVGKRFHAVHLPDYDLCEAWFGNYNGTVEFVEAVLGTCIKWDVV
jgi:Zinc finger, ZZ type